MFLSNQELGENLSSVVGKTITLDSPGAGIAENVSSCRFIELDFNGR